MPKIRIPPPFSHQLAQELLLQSQDFLSLLEKYGAVDAKGRYLPWHEFQWRVEPTDAKPAAWMATKIARYAITKRFQLLPAENNQCFGYCVPDSLFAQLHNIDKMTGGGHKISNDIFDSSSDKTQYLVKSLMMEEAITSSQLEGASTTREVAQEMLEKNLTPKDKSQQMILNNYRLMKKAVEIRQSELSIELIIELHEIATYQAIENNAIPGELRNNNEIVVADWYGENTFHPPDYRTIQSRLTDLCIFANLDHNQSDCNLFIHPVVKAIILHFMIGYIHPFGDGNGRTARAIFYWSVMRSGYWLFEYVSISKLIKEKQGAYAKAFIYTETDDYDLTYFIYNQVEVIAEAIQSLFGYIHQKRQGMADFVKWVNQSALAQTLKPKEREILQEAMQKPGREFTAKQVAINYGISENTARSYLNQLVDKDLLLSSQAKSGKTLLYLAPANLRTRLKL
jgi:Fic family protein